MHNLAVTLAAAFAVVVKHTITLCCSVLCCAQENDFPTDVDFKWAQDSYNVTQRNIDTWLFFGVFRAQLWLLDQKWSYPGGFTGKAATEQTAADRCQFPSSRQRCKLSISAAAASRYGFTGNIEP